MERVQVEYIDGPCDGRREMLPLGPDGAPPPDRVLTADPLPERWDSINQSTPAVPAQAHRYARALLVAVADGVARWQYHHRGALA